MIKVITATPGSGKTLYTISLIDAILSQDKPLDDIEALSQDPPRLIYTNIEGLKKDKFQHPERLNLFPTPEEWGVNPFDWRDTPDGSVIIYDEAQFFFPTRPNADTEKIITEMSTHRHQGKDIYIITQDPSLIHSKIRALCGEHTHLYRAFGMSVATKYIWQHLVTNPNSRMEQTRAQQELFTFPKKYYDYYQSATQHTVKRRLPKKLKRIAFAIVCLLLFCGYMLTTNGLKTFGIGGHHAAPIAEASTSLVGTPTSDVETQAVPETTPPPQAYAWSSTPEASTVAGCVANKHKHWCQCYGANGATLAMSDAQCLSVLGKPLPRLLRAGGQQQSTNAGNND